MLFWIVFGLIVGLLAQWLYPYERFGILGSIILGIVGSFVGGFLGTLFFGYGVSGFNLSSLIVAVIGSIIVIWIARHLGGPGGYNRRF